MRKITIIICLIAGICIFFGACSDSETYADKVNQEKKYIKDFLNEHNVEVLSEYPSNGVFKSNQFYLDASGVYINVVDSGNGKRASTYSNVYYRFTDAMWLPAEDSDTLSLVDISTQPLEFRYGDAVSYSYSSSYDYRYYYLCPGAVVPLKYVGEGAVVKLLIPFKSTTGSAYQTSSYSTLYHSRLEYTKISD